MQIPHFEQSAAGYCLPACIRMILATLGIHRSEAVISQIIGARAYGAPSFSVMRLETLGLRVEYRSWSLPDLLKAIDTGTPVISFVRTQFLDHWREDVAHAVVVIAAEPDRLFWIHDPALQSGPVATHWNGLLAAWAEFSYRGATINLR